MDKKIFSFLFSTRLMATLFLVFAIAMGVGTFIESKYNTDTARILVYNSWWFEAIMVFFMINFLGNIKRYQLLKKEKWATLLLHIAFIFILLGAFVTRYISYEGVMPIREGAAENQILSEKTYLTIFADGEYKGEMKRRVFEKSLLLSPVTNNDFTVSGKFDQTPFEVTYSNYILGAKEMVKPDAKGTLYLKLVEAGEGGREEHFLKEGEVQNIHNVLFALNKPTAGAININTTGEKYTIQTPFEGTFMRMADKLQGTVTKENIQPLMMRSLYSIGDIRIVFPDPAVRGTIAYESNNDFKAKAHNDVLVVKVKAEGQEKEITLMGSKGRLGEPKSVKIGNIDYTLFYGSKAYVLPFKIKLNDFIATKYPGTEKSYSAFESKVTVQDSATTFDAAIYMNHVLDYKGFRFFQSSFDPDEKGTVLSVNHDFWGTSITYLGYFMLYFGMMAIMFTKNSRFADLKRKLDVVKKKKEKLITILVLMLSFGGFAQAPHVHKHQNNEDPNDHANHVTAPPSEKQIDSLLNIYKAPEAHAAKFGRLIIQDAGGRMKPINTFSSELLRKVSQNDTYSGMNSDQVFLSMTQYAQVWIQVPIIHLRAGNDSIRKIIGVEKEAKKAPFVKFFDANGNYKLSPYLDAAYKAANPNQFEKDFIETDKRVNLMESALSGSILKIFPIPNDPNNKWISYLELEHAGLKGMDATYTKQIIPLYFSALNNGAITKDFKTADQLVESINGFQKKFGSKVRPSERKIDLEIASNKYNILPKMVYWYLLTGIFMLIFTLFSTFFDKKFLRVTVNGFHILIGLIFGVHTLALIARWYISGHAPWSNAYEAIVYVAWSTMFFGLAFDRKSKLTVASAAFVTAMIFMSSNLNWIDPEISNLQPVLNSYWLMIHVAVIVASYGPTALGMILGFVALILIFFTNEKNKEKMSLNIKEITYINEMALTIGLIMLTIGNFLGGQWANESWGRYWGWDPKETWALISIMVYAFVIHARFVPSLRSAWFFNVMSMFAFISILFTYYGVNFHLVGLHSYASGEAHSLSWIWYSMGAIALIAAVTYPAYRKYYKK
ncbi:cytochrome c biogenesis protein CcsA [Flavobacterium sp. Fl-77]|uniref:Cytochrome c biogenesis protein CcsA n=1 Tax=Flavobacterium flavipigmentatum TaxID=2893884 RepID=A0AAJ2W1M6_9FLAO|nr:MULTISPECIES: cytochrome c biogenesis protein CcsA [unclassified Flavobacterium]MDX6182962.1 cytochrome c biogenesis protein CcsA [Flavobacterium sp. Fl-33]MDX6186415.1 cytochrome c biogenesis protein CcsA [Flavobacterium sp. Fl-77]UFH37798.1 cytochrome c biogenesis protein CcsA [Flavobacterium sp. F-70]